MWNNNKKLELMEGARVSTEACHSQANKRGASLMAAPKEGKKLKEFTLVFCRRTSSSSVDDGCNELLLGLKKQGFGEGKWNGEHVQRTGCLF